jgi:SAM-dependent methyltransferase
MNHAAIRYLESKRSVDDRALSRRVRDRLLSELPAAPRVLEAGCGTGATVARLHDWGVTPASYRGVDRDEGVVAFARRVRPAARRRDGDDAVETDRGYGIDGRAFAFETGDALEAFDDEGAADLLVAQAFADLVSLSEMLDAFEAAVRPGGLVYLPITFDGGTIFQPDHPADDAIERAYHRSIDRRPGRDARAGRHLAELLRDRAGELLAVSSSDWIVRPRDGAYPADEAYFLGRILGFVEDALADSSEAVDGRAEWLQTRREQLAAGELTYVAHQYDLLYRTPDARSATRSAEP